MSFIGKVCLVTGGSRGIGRATALKFAKQGADIVIAYKSNHEAAKEVKKLVNSKRRSCLLVQTDISNSTQVQSLINKTINEYGRIDILVNNAGTIGLKPFIDLTEEEWDEVIDTNLKGCFLCGQAVATEMVKQKQGKIINVSSLGDRFVAKGRAPYHVSKIGIDMLTKVMAVELAEYRINVNAVAPGITDTDMNKKVIQNKNLLSERLKHIPLNRVAQPEEIAGVILFLASKDADFITGEIITIDGGDSLQLDIIKRV